MKRTDLPAQLQQLARRIPYVTIASVCPDGSPWNSPVVGKFDSDMNLYWISWKGSQHSKNISQEPRIFVVIYDSQVPEGQGQGLYLQMKAHELVDGELSEAQKMYDASFFTHEFQHGQFMGSCPQRIYKAVPDRVWHNIDGEEQGHFVDKRVEFVTKVGDAAQTSGLSANSSPPRCLAR